MLIIIYSLLFIIFIIIVLFAFPKFSPIPYFPTNKKDLPLITKALELKNNQTIVDLGAGDGVVIFEAAKKAHNNKLNTKFIAVEINPILIFILHLRRLFHSNKKNIKIIMANMFSIDFQTFKLYNFITFYLYISPWYLEKTMNNIQKQFKHFNVVSYMYSVKRLKKREKIIKGKRHNIFVYNI